MNNLSGKTVLVTGASGFIGARLAQRLKEGGTIVHGWARHQQLRNHACNHWWQIDITDVDQVRRQLDAIQPSHIFHLAGHVSGSRALDAVLPTLHANLVGMTNLLVAATERGGIRLLLTGSLEEPDATSPVPASPYAAAKHAGAAYARMFHALYGASIVWLRLFMTYGPAQRDFRKLVPYVTRSLLRGESPRVSSGTRDVDWIYVDDVVNAFLLAATASGVEGQTFDIGSGALIPVRNVIEQLVQIIKPEVLPEFGAVPERPLERIRVADVAKTAACLGWRAQTPLDVGLRKTVDWYRSHGIVDIAGPDGAIP